VIWKYTDLAIIVPMLGREWTVESILASAKEATPGANVVFVCTYGDSEVLKAVRDSNANNILVPPRKIGDYAHKINVGYKQTTEPLIFTGACDINFHPGWFELATELLQGNIGVVGTNDLGLDRSMNGQHSTHSLVTRKYADQHGTIDEPGKILHEGYVHEYSDDELVQTAKLRGMWAWSQRSIVEHMHPAWGKGVWDDSYNRWTSRMEASEALFKERSKMWTRP